VLELIDYGAANAIDIVAMSTHGRGGFGRALLGSTATTLMRDTKIPLLVARSTRPR
jgi:nucleotide-binding universal stress UspA family protein